MIILSPALRKFRVLMRQADLEAESKYSINSPIRDLVLWKYVSVFCKKWGGWTRENSGEQWPLLGRQG